MCGTPRPADDPFNGAAIAEIELAGDADEQTALRQCIAAEAAVDADASTGAASASTPAFPSVAYASSCFHLDVRRLEPSGEDAAQRQAFVEREVGDRLALQTLRNAGLIDFAPGTYLFPLRTIGDGNCLLHAASQALWGTQDRARNLRSVLAQAMLEDDCASALRSRWQLEVERLDATLPADFRVRV